MHKKKTLKDAPWWKKTLLALVALGFLVIGGVLVWASTVKLPDISTFEARKIANSSKITDRTGEIVLYDIHQNVRRTEIPLTEMGDNIKNAVVSIEDAHFYEHNGIRPTSILRAIAINVTKGSFSQGGSTITQQIIKNTLLNTDKNVVRKLKEWVLAVRLERNMSKDQILGIYLNDAPFGSTIYGVQEAAKAFFNKDSKDLTVGEASYLAAMIPAPTYYSPFGTHKDKLDARHLLVLKKMEEYGYIDSATYATAASEKVTFIPSASNSIKAPHFVFYILDYLQKKYGEDVMESGGYTIKTTIDYDLQVEAEKIIADQAAKNNAAYRASNSALVAIDPKTGQILSMVGSRNYFDKDIDGAYNVATANRQPGSSFKPFIYVTAFDKGYLPETILFDVDTEFSTSCSADHVPSNGDPKTCYHPSNFDDKFKGPISLRSALAESRNIPSVKLLYLVGVDAAVETAHKLGITTLKDPKQIGLSLVLGGGEVKLLDMASAYGTLANSGVRNPVAGILEVRDQKGNTIEKFEENSSEVMNKNAVLTLNDVLSDDKARTPTFGSSITIPGVAVKTGTTNENKDAWIMGYTPEIAVGIWSGNNDNKSMGSGGGTISGPALKTFMNDVVFKKYPATPFEKPIPDPEKDNLKPVLRGQWMGNRSVMIDKITGLRATDATPAESRIEKIITDVQDILFWVDKKDPRGAAPSNPNNDPQFRLWNPPVQTWWMNNASNYNVTTEMMLPTEYETVHEEASNDKPIINGLPDELYTTDTATVTVSSKGKYPLTSVDIFMDNTYVTTLASPFRFHFIPKDYGFEPGKYTFKATATNSIFTKTTTEAKITLQ